VNAAFLLVTGAMLVGQAGEKKVTPPPVQPVPVPAATSSSGCCNNSDPCGCESFGHKLRHQLGGLFQRNNCNSCQPTSCDNNRSGHHNRGGCNDDCGRGKLWTGGGHHNNNNCAPTCTDSCGRGGFNLLSNLRHRFGRNDCGCDGGCNSTTAPTGAPYPPVKPGEKIDAPKKMPVDPTPKKTSTEVRFESTPTPIAAPATIQPLPTPPAVEVTPVVPVPRVEGDRRDPF
jgi:hypothetical protein